MKFHIHTFGCQMNVNDAEWLRRSLLRLGHEESPEHEADACILMTCSVRDKPEQKVYSALGRYRPYYDNNKRFFAAVGGCTAQQVGEELRRRFPFVRLIFGTDGIINAPAAIERLMQEPKAKFNLLDFSEEFPERDALVEAGDFSGSAFVNIMQGCNNFCAFCIVPYLRGRQKSRKSHIILDECKALIQAGIKEITLLGQNVNSYGLDKYGDGVTFFELLSRIDALPDLERLRFTTSHPKDIADEVIQAFGSMKTLCPQLHLPVQSGSDAVLKAMGRKYTSARYLEIIDGLRSSCPGIQLSTDFLVGFPGETEQDFQQTLQLLQRVEYDGSFSFMYSDRPGVRSESMEPKIPLEEKAERLQILQDMQREFTTRSLHNMVGRKLSVLVEGAAKKPSKDGLTIRGRDIYGHVVNVNYRLGKDSKSFAELENTLRGTIVPVKITEAKKHSLWGKMVG